MKRTIATLLLVCATAFSGDVLERPITATGTGATVNVTCPFGTAYLRDVFLVNGSGAIQTGAVSLVNTSTGFTNASLGTYVFTNMSRNRLSQVYPMQQGDVLTTTFTFHSNGISHSVHAWFENVQR